jgi:hypothetical protein
VHAFVAGLRCLGGFSIILILELMKIRGNSWESARPRRLLIAFSDIGKVVTWGPEVTVIPATENGEAIKTIKSRVTVVDSVEIEDDTRAAVAEVSQGANGALHIKMHDKIAAIDKLARALGMYTKKLDVNTKALPVPVTIYEGRPTTRSPGPRLMPLVQLYARLYHP